MVAASPQDSAVDRSVVVPLRGSESSGTGTVVVTGHASMRPRVVVPIWSYPEWEKPSRAEPFLRADGRSMLEAASEMQVGA